jgi:uncharacterized phage protein (TIGR01671 family)
MKLRVWDKKEKKMYYSGFWIGQRKDGIDFVYSNIPQDEQPDIDDIVIERYIEDKDKNGVEIYEGDVFTFSGRDPRISVHPVVFHHGAFGYTPFGIDGKFMSFHSNRENIKNIDGRLIDIEVIGNIHENPELLENKDGDGVK